MPKMKVSLFFHTENEEEKKAYELLVSLGRRKSVTIAELLNAHMEEIGQIWENKYTSSHADHPVKHEKSDKLEPISSDDVKKKEATQPKAVSVTVNENNNANSNVNEDGTDEKKETVYDTVPVENNDSENKYDSSLIMKGLEMFGI